MGETTPPAKKPDRRVIGAIGAVTLGAVVLGAAVLWAQRSPDEAARNRPSAVTVDVLTRGHSWRFDYPRYGVSVSDPSPAILLPAGGRIGFTLRTADVIHSMWIPRLKGKQDIIPGQPNTFVLQTGAVGTYTGTDAEYAGIRNKLPTFEVRVVPFTEFEQWVADVRSAASS